MEFDLIDEKWLQSHKFNFISGLNNLNGLFSLLTANYWTEIFGVNYCYLVIISIVVIWVGV